MLFDAFRYRSQAAKIDATSTVYQQITNPARLGKKSLDFIEARTIRLYPKFKGLSYKQRVALVEKEKLAKHTNIFKILGLSGLKDFIAKNNIKLDIKSLKVGFLAILGAPEIGQVGFQLPASSIMEGIITLHHDMMFFLVFISIFVLYILIVIAFRFNTVNHKRLSLISHHTGIEIIWTIIPTIILILVALPSFVLLYSMDELYNPFLTLKVIGRQWYWSYEYADTIGTREYGVFNETLDNNQDIVFDAYMDPEVESSQFRLLKSDNTVYLPIQQHVRVLVTSSDVIHS